MNILVIGNGFDKALSLPTDYVDFLKFADYMKWFTSADYKIGVRDPESFGIDSRIITLINEQCGNIHDNLFSRKDEIRSLCRCNFWLDSFLDKQETLIKQGRDRWVDFETEISKQVGLFLSFRTFFKILKKCGNSSAL